MAASINTTAVVLRREDWNGNDARITLFTKERGKIEARAKGLRKAKSKLAAHLEPLTQTEIFLVEGKRFPILAGSVVLNRYPILSSSFSRLANAGLLLRLADLMTTFEVPDEKTYALLLEGMNVLNQEEEIRDEDAERLAHVFAWKLLTLSGYHAELRKCLVCQQSIEGERIAFSVRRGGVAHDRCQGEEGAMVVGFAAIKGLAYMVEAPLADSLRLRSANGGLRDMLIIIRSLVEERFEIGQTSHFWQLK